MKVHLIAIGGALMHNLALALQAQGCSVTGSDDEIYEPSRSRLQSANLLPETLGWQAERIRKDLDLVIIGMHARADNPELLAAQRLGLRICSYPEFLRQHSERKTRIAIAGSHGKTTTTAMIMHALRRLGIDFDYAVGAAVEGFDCMVRLSDSAPYMVVEADEYLSSPIDARPKMLHYAPHFAVITGIEHDHFNVFPTLESYLRAFGDFIATLPAGAQLFYDAQSAEAANLVDFVGRKDLFFTPYFAAPHRINAEGITFLQGGQEYPLRIFGGHNMRNMQAARLILAALGLEQNAVDAALSGFSGAARRLQKLVDSGGHLVFSDFAHAPSKVRATVQALREQYPRHRLVAAFELHTFSSLNADFLPQYARSLSLADACAVYFSPHTLQQKRLPALSFEQIRSAFEQEDLQIFTHAEELQKWLQTQQKSAFGAPVALLLMSSGTWSGCRVWE